MYSMHNALQDVGQAKSTAKTRLSTGVDGRMLQTQHRRGRRMLQTQGCMTHAKQSKIIAPIHISIGRTHFCFHYRKDIHRINPGIHEVLKAVPRSSSHRTHVAQAGACIGQKEDANAMGANVSHRQKRRSRDFILKGRNGSS